MASADHLPQELRDALWGVLERAEDGLADYDFPEIDYGDAAEAEEAQATANRQTALVRSWLEGKV